MTMAATVPYRRTLATLPFVEQTALNGASEVLFRWLKYNKGIDALVRLPTDGSSQESPLPALGKDSSSDAPILSNSLSPPNVCNIN